MTDAHLSSVAPYPRQLLDWAGNRAGGVRRLFDEKSGRPSNTVLTTNLLHKLEHWASDFARGDKEAPRILLLVGGPGNGKTEAIESTVSELDKALGKDGSLVDELKKAFSPDDGLVPRVVTAQIHLGSAQATRLSIVQDASVVTQSGNHSAAALLVNELEEALANHAGYLCCANRGVLDDALILAMETGAEKAKALLESITRGVSLFT